VLESARPACANAGAGNLSLLIPTATNIVFIGPASVGKSGLATGLLLKAFQNGYRALFVKAQDLFDDLYASLADRSSRKLIDRLARVPLLCIEERDRSAVVRLIADLPGPAPVVPASCFTSTSRSSPYPRRRG